MENEKEQVEEGVKQAAASTTEPDEVMEVEKVEKQSKVNFDFKRSVEETKSIFLDALLRPHSVVASNRSIGIETSGILLALFSLLITISAFLFYQYGFDGFLSWFADIGVGFFFKVFFSWLVTYAIGYFSLYLFLTYLGEAKRSHRELLTKYVVVMIPFTVIFCLVILFFGFVLVDLFVITYALSLMLYGVIHVYLFMVNMKQPKFDLFWMMAAYLLLLTVATYLVAGFDISAFS